MDGGTQGMRVKAAATLAAAMALLCGAAAPALAGEVTTEPIEASPAPGPPETQSVHVSKFGPEDASRVLVLVPGTVGGAGDFTLLAEDIVATTPDLEVWALDRRSQGLEDTSVFEQVLAGTATPDDAFDYYLNWIVTPSITEHYEPLEVEDTQYATEWGLEVALEDTRRVVKAARDGGRDVYLGGHSLGASTAAAYAAWDFKGRPGYKDLSGLVLVDGGLMGTFNGYSKPEAKDQLETLAARPFADLLNLDLPWAAGAFAEVGSLFALDDPTASSPLQNSILLPEAFRPPVEVTNRAQLGYAFDSTTSPKPLSLIHVRAGGLAASGTPRDWEDGEVSTVGRLAETFGQEPANAIEWYFPRRLTIDVNGADRMARNKVAKLLGLRLWHTKGIDVPLLALQTSLTVDEDETPKGTVLKGAKELIKKSKIPKGKSILIDESDAMSHLDPLTARPEANPLVSEIGGFLGPAR